MSTKQKGVRILAKTLFKDLTARGYDQREIVSLATQLIGQVTADIQSRALESTAR